MGNYWTWCTPRLQICPRKTFSETTKRHRWYWNGSKYGWIQGFGGGRFRAKSTTCIPPLKILKPNVERIMANFSKMTWKDVIRWEWFWEGIKLDAKMYDHIERFPFLPCHILGGSMIYTPMILWSWWFCIIFVSGNALFGARCHMRTPDFRYSWLVNLPPLTSPPPQK